MKPISGDLGGAGPLVSEPDCYGNPKKNIARSPAIFYHPIAQASHSGGTRIAKLQNMRSSNARRSALFLFATALICLDPRFMAAQDAVATPEVTTSPEPKAAPIEKVGIGNFATFPVHLSLDVRGGYDDNVTTSSTNQQASWFTSGSVAMNYEFGSPRTKLTLAIGAGGTYYWDHPQSTGTGVTDYDINTHFRFSLTHKASPRLIFDTVDYAAYLTEPDFSLAQGSNRRSGNYFFTQDKGTATYFWTPRFSTATSYTFGALHYDDASTGYYSDYIENTIGNEFRYLIWPTTKLVAEYRFQTVNYQYISGRNSTTHYALGGFEHVFTPEFGVSLRGGAQFRSYDQGDTLNSPYFEAMANYAAGKRTVISWTNHYAIEEPDQALSQSRQTFRTGLTAKHDLTSRTSATLAGYYEHDDYQSLTTGGVVNPGYTEDVFDLSVTLRYAITRYLGVDLGYDYTDVSSKNRSQEYSRNRLWGGFSATF